MQQQVEEEYPDKISYICSTDRNKIEEKITRQWKANSKIKINNLIKIFDKISYCIKFKQGNKDYFF